MTWILSPFQMCVKQSGGALELLFFFENEEPHFYSTTAASKISSLVQADLKLVGPLSAAVVGDIASVPRINALEK